jgi:hypothetical protein
MSGSTVSMAQTLAKMRDPRRGKVINHDGIVADIVVRMMRRHWDLDEERENGASFRRRKQRIDYLVLFTLRKYDDGKRWIHLSMSRGDKKLPTWSEMTWLRDEFIGKDTKAIIVLAPAAEHCNLAEAHHIWHCVDGDPLPDFTNGLGLV